MQSLARLTLVSLALAGVVSSQHDFSPAKELAKYDRLAGHWQGSGQVYMGAGTEPAQWTATSHCRKALGGHYYRTDELIDLGPEAPAKLCFRSHVGWDAENQRYMTYGLSNMGGIEAVQVHWIDDDTMVTTSHTVQGGQLMIDRWTTKLGKDSYTIHGLRSVGDGEFFTHVKGSFKRVKSDKDVQLVDASLVPAAEQNQKLARMSGAFKMKGAMVPAPGAPEMAITATMHSGMVLGGNACELTVKGDPTEGSPVVYEGWGAIAWDQSLGAYRSLWLDNMGGGMVAEARWVSDTELVTTNAAMYHGQPTVGRSVLVVDEAGVPVKEYSHHITAASAPQKVFEASYQKQ